VIFRIKFPPLENRRGRDCGMKCAHGELSANRVRTGPARAGDFLGPMPTLGEYTVRYPRHALNLFAEAELLCGP
jgi:hypothetical protein